jgi:hypothetical protein
MLQVLRRFLELLVKAVGTLTNAGTVNFSGNTGTVTVTTLSGAGSTTFGSNATITNGISAGTVSATGALNSAISGGTVSAGSLGQTTAANVSGGTTNISGAATVVLSCTLQGCDSLHFWALVLATITTMSGGSLTASRQRYGFNLQRWCN